MCKVLSLDVIISFDEDFTQSAFPYWIILRIELVKPMEGVSVLKNRLHIFVISFHAQSVEIAQNKTCTVW